MVSQLSQQEIIRNNQMESKTGNNYMKSKNCEIIKWKIGTRNNQMENEN